MARRKVPPLNALRSFEAAARLGSFKEAAEEMNVSQSAISHQVKLLEEHLGIALFVRRTRAVELTRSGRVYYPIIRDAFDRIVEGTDLILTPLNTSAITLQVYSTFTIRWLIHRLADFQKRHPEVQVRLNTSQEQVDFSRDEVDACIMVGHPTDRSVHYDFLFRAEMFPVCSPGFLEESSSLKRPADLGKHNLLQVYPSERDWWVWLEAMGVTNVNPEVGLQFDSYDLALTAVRQGIGIALGQQPYVSRELATGQLIEVFPGVRVPNPNKWYLACRAEHANNPKINTFRRWLLREVAQDPDLLSDGVTAVA